MGRGGFSPPSFNIPPPHVYGSSHEILHFLTISEKHAKSIASEWDGAFKKESEKKYALRTYLQKVLFHNTKVELFQN